MQPAGGNLARSVFESLEHGSLSYGKWSSFDNAVQEKSQRSLDTDTATAMLALLLGKRWSLLPHFHQFLEVAASVEYVVTRCAISLIIRCTIYKPKEWGLILNTAFKCINFDTRWCPLATDNSTVFLSKNPACFVKSFGFVVVILTSLYCLSLINLKLLVSGSFSEIILAVLVALTLSDRSGIWPLKKTRLTGSKSSPCETWLYSETWLYWWASSVFRSFYIINKRNIEGWNISYTRWPWGTVMFVLDVILAPEGETKAHRLEKGKYLLCYASACLAESMIW